MTKKVVCGEVFHYSHSAPKLPQGGEGGDSCSVAESFRGPNTGEAPRAAGACQEITLEPASEALSAFRLSLNIMPAGPGNVFKGSTFTSTEQEDKLGGKRQ